MWNKVMPMLTLGVVAVSPLQAQDVQPMTAEQLKIYLPKDEDLETRTDGDLTGDRVVDTAFIGRGEDKRTLTVLRTVKGEFDIDFEPVGSLELDAYPQGPAEMSIAKGVLKIVDLTGGTTATQATYRYRYDPAARRMRLIGLDATLYSRTYAHDGFEISWNLLTGDFITQDMKLNKKGGDAAYDPIIEKKGKRPSKPLYMEDTPNPEELIEGLRN